MKSRDDTGLGIACFHDEAKDGKIDAGVAGTKNLKHLLGKVRKAKAGGQSPDRDAQFRILAQLIDDYSQAGNPGFSMDTKAKEFQGQLYLLLVDGGAATPRPSTFSNTTCRRSSTRSASRSAWLTIRVTARNTIPSNGVSFPTSAAFV